jgi:FkbM family methyltransferase
MKPRWGERAWRAWKRRIWVRVLRRVHPEIEVTLGQQRLRIDLRDEIIGTLLYLGEDYESELQRLMRCLDLDGAVCLDIGANIGIHTLLMSELVGPGGRVFAFEPQSRNFELLRENLQLNGASNVVARQVAAGDREGVCRLALHPTNYGDHRVTSAGDGAEEAPITTIDSALRDSLDGCVGLIKIDVQGYESHVIRGMQETLRRNPGAILIVEVFPEGLHAAGSSAAEMVSSLRECGLDGWEFHDFRLIPCQAPHVYDLIRGGKHQDLVLSRHGGRITGVLERLYGQSLREKQCEPVGA